MNPQRIVRHARRATIAFAAVAIFYLVSRYGVVPVPAEGESPIFGIGPGSRLLVDTWADAPNVEDVVLFRHEQGGATVLQLGRVRSAPSGASLPADSLWIECDDVGVAGFDSAVEGPVAKERVVARVLFAF
ncbi:MAG: hypothetical protein R3F34_17670 [Planctomycetota bacterium]